MKQTAWKPVIEGKDAAVAWKAIEAIAEDIQAIQIAKDSQDSSQIKDFSMSSGLAGYALFFAYLDRAAPGKGYGDLSRQYLDRCVEAVATVRMPPHFYGGFSGIAWVAEHLRSKEDEDDPNAEIDEALIEYLANLPEPTHYDLVSGVVGLSAYFLERPVSETNRQAIELAVEFFQRHALEQKEGLAWFTPPELVPSLQKDHAPNGYFNLGLAHGIPGVISVLGGAAKRVSDSQTSRRLVREASRWMNSCRLEGHLGARFPYWVGDGGADDPARSAWCYGDPGVGAAFFWAARSLSLPEFEKDSLQLLREAVQRPEPDCRIADAGLCHGAVGLAMIYNRVFQDTQDEQLGAGAKKWFLRALEMRKEGKGVGGFQSFTPGMEVEWDDDLGLLTGSAGIGLGLLSAVTPQSPEWDRVLLISQFS